MDVPAAASRTEPGSGDAVKAVSVIGTGTVRIRREHLYGTRKPLYWWLLTSRQSTPPQAINVCASVTDGDYFPGGFTGLIYRRLARFDIGEQDTP